MAHLATSGPLCGCFYKLVLVAGMLVTRALLFGVYTRAAYCWKLLYRCPYTESPAIGFLLGVYIDVRKFPYTISHLLSAIYYMFAISYTIYHIGVAPIWHIVPRILEASIQNPNLAPPASCITLVTPARPPSRVTHIPRTWQIDQQARLSWMPTRGM